MNLSTGNIIPGKNIGPIYLGCSLYTLKKTIGENYVEEQRVNCKVLTIDDAKFWIDNSDIVFQIAVYGNFEGKFLNRIGIGSTLADVEEYVGKWEESLDVYTLIDYKGICFELKEEEDWDEINTPIEFISIYL